MNDFAASGSVCKLRSKFHYLGNFEFASPSTLPSLRRTWEVETASPYSFTVQLLDYNDVPNIRKASILLNCVASGKYDQGQSH